MAEKQGIRLNTIDGFPTEQASKLAELWITTAEELVDADRREGGRSGLAAYLGISVDEVGDLVRMAEDVLPVDYDFGPDEIEYFGTGSMDEPDEDEPDEDPVSFGPMPPKVDLHERLPPIRNQGGRGTCVSFTCTAVREYLLGEESEEGDLSEQYLYWGCKERDGYAGSGTWIRIGMEALEQDGVCTETVWPYNSSKIQGNEGQGPPPTEAAGDASKRKITGSVKLPSKGVNSIKEKIADELPVAFAVPVYTYWFTSPVRTSGDIRLPLENDKVEGGHAMCMVGYEDDGDVPGGGYFIVRNSWGTGWAGNNAVSPGYCRIPYAYIEQYGRSAYVALGAAKPLDDDIEDDDILDDDREQQRSILDVFIEWLKRLFS